MKLCSDLLKDTKILEEKGYSFPKYDREAMVKRTKGEPKWLHFGAGNIFRAFLAKASEELLNAGASEYGIIAAEIRDRELVEKAYAPYDDLFLLAEFGEGEEIKKSAIGSIAEVCTEYDRMKEIFVSPSLELASFTVTEKGYKLSGTDGNVFPDVKEDIENGPDTPKSFMGKVTALLYERYRSGELPIAMVSMDNCSDNGAVLFSAVSHFADEWKSRGLADEGFCAYIRSDKVSFPTTMIDKITPSPDPSIEKIFTDDGFEDIGCIVTAMKSFTAAFVNAEETGYLVIEDVFPNSRPDFEKCGFYMTNLDTVKKVEKMKVGAALNPLHTALAIFGCLLGYTKISEEMKDPLLVKLIKKLGYNEGLPAVPKQDIISPEKFIGEVINVRLPSPRIPDTPQRIASDTSMKLSVRFGETVQYYLSDDTYESADELVYIPLVMAAWLRYLMGKDDSGREFERSPDPFLSDERADYFRGIGIGEDFNASVAKSILSDAKIFGCDISATPLYGKVLRYFVKMMSHENGVREILEEMLT